MESAAAAAPSWQHFSHAADIGVQGRGRSLAEAFAMAATALVAAITDPAAVISRQSVSVVCAAPDREMLLVDWLNAVIYEMEMRQMLFSHFDVAIEGTRLSATLGGEPLDPERHQPAVGPKGATLTALKVAEEGGLWVAQCVVDV